MPYKINETHDPKLESWVESANETETDFPIQNLPFALRITQDDDGYWAGVVVPIGDQVLDLNQVSLSDDLVEDDDRWALTDVDALIEDGSAGWIRRRVQELLTRDNPRLRDHADRDDYLSPMSEAHLIVPFSPMDYTDFYASLHHATNVGSMFRPDNPLLPNYKHIPIGYHGRASSIVPSGTVVRRPVGQQAPTEEGGSPGFGPCKMLDYELEMGLIVGRGNEMGRPVSIHDAEDHIFGMCIVNDWSARDIQKWEYQPLGPFLSKSFATTVSPCIVTMEALAPFRVPAFERADGDPRPLPYLDSDDNRERGGVDITCEVHLSSSEMRQRGHSPVRLSRGSFKNLYWTLAQFVTHHTLNGCNLQPGDLLASGTVSGPSRDSRGCLLELTWDGDPWGDPPTVVPGTQRTPIKLPTGEERKFLADGDEVIIKAYCEREGYRRIGFGECRGVIEPAG